MFKKTFPGPFSSSLDASWKEGIAASTMQFISDYFVIPLALLMGAAASQIAFITSFPHLLTAILLFLSIPFLHLIRSRKNFLVFTAFGQASLLIGIALLAVASGPQRLFFFTVLVVIFRVLGNLIATVWSSLMSDYLEPKERGGYLGWRSQILSIAGIAAMLGGGLLLNTFKQTSPATGFALLFIIAGLARFISSHFMTLMQDVSIEHKPENLLHIKDLVMRAKKSGLAKFTAFVAAITFTTHLSAPFFSVHMLRDLHFDYLHYSFIHLSAVIAGIIAFPIWGKNADLVGNAKIIRVTARIIPFIPLLWILGSHPVYLIAVEMAAGFVWGGFNLCSVNYIYDAVSQPRRLKILTYFNLVNGLAIFLGATAGGYLAENLPRVFAYPLQSLFFVSFLLRLLAYVKLSKGWTEVRHDARKVSSQELYLSVLGIRPLVGQNQNLNPYSNLPKEEAKETPPDV